MEGNQFFGLKLDWNYDDGYVDMKIPNCVSDTLYFFKRNHHHDHNISRVIITQSVMERNYSMPKFPTCLNILTRNKRNICNLLLAHSCIINEILTPHCYLNLIRSQVNSHNLHKKLWMNSNSLCTMQLHTPIPTSTFMLVTLS